MTVIILGLLSLLLAAGVAEAQFVTPSQPVTITSADGSQVVQITATAGGALQIECVAGCGGGGPVTANQGTPSIIANAWPVRLCDTASGFCVAVDASGRVTVLQGTSPWVVSGTVSATQGTIPWAVDGSGVVQPVSGAVTAIPPYSLGQTTMSASVPVTLARDQPAISVTETPMFLPAQPCNKIRRLKCFNNGGFR